MYRRQIALLMLGCALLLVVSRSASAQGIGGGYAGGHSDNPNGPTVSPYLNLLSTNQFGISNYHTLVKPMEDQRRDIMQQGADIQRLQQNVNQQQSRTSAAGIRGTGLPPGYRESRYMNYKHYYTFRQQR